jgi:hypothetical protein
MQKYKQAPIIRHSLVGSEGDTRQPEGRGFNCRYHWIFKLTYPSSRTMGLGSTQPLTEMSTRNIAGGKGRPARKADLIVNCEPIV